MTRKINILIALLFLFAALLAAGLLSGAAAGSSGAALAQALPAVSAPQSPCDAAKATAASPGAARTLAAKAPPKTDKDANDAKDKSDKSKKPDKIPPIYTSYLKDPSKLGFKPDEPLFKNVYFYLRNFYVDPVSEKSMCEGLLEQMKILLRDAKLSARGLPSLKDESNVTELFEKMMKQYSGKVDRYVLAFACIEGMIGGTKDPHSVLMTPKDYGFMMEKLQNKNFSGIGIYIEKDKDNHNYLTVIEPIEGTPAYKAGLQPGDAIVKADGHDTSNLTMEECVAIIRGPLGTAVKLIVQRKGGLQREIIIKRASIHVPSVTFKMEEGEIGYIRLRTFGIDSGNEVGSAIEALKAKGAKALILDLRNNTGGYINTAVDVCSHLLPEGSLVVYTINRNKSRQELNVHAAERAELPMAVLINAYSASASEITAGAIKDFKTATLRGTKSFGKGSVQQPFSMAGGSVLKLTVAHFYTPKGVKIDGKGVTPDVEVKMEPRGVGKPGDVQLKKALEVLKAKISR